MYITTNKWICLFKPFVLSTFFKSKPISHPKNKIFPNPHFWTFLIKISYLYSKNLCNIRYKTLLNYKASNKSRLFTVSSTYAYHHYIWFVKKNRTVANAPSTRQGSVCKVFNDCFSAPNCYSNTLYSPLHFEEHVAAIWGGLDDVWFFFFNGESAS